MFKVLKNSNASYFKLFKDNLLFKKLEKNNVNIAIGCRQLRVVRRRALPFPPNYLDSHQVFYPSLQKLLEDKEHIENRVKLIDIGLKPSRTSQPSDVSSKTQKTKDQVSHPYLSSTEDILKLVDFDEKMEKVDYEQIYKDWSSSDSGIQMVINLACYYGIYRDLFYDPSFKRIDKTVKVKFGDYFPRYERALTQEIKEYFPGGVRIEDSTSIPIKYFAPIAPMHIEFTADQDVNSDEVEVSPVYRGNHIKPKYCKSKPNVVIDAALVTGSQSPKDCLSNLVEPGIKLIGDSNSFYTLALFNLDSQFGDSNPLCHWMACNIKSESYNKSATYDELISYLPPYGIRGLGYHRYVFLLVRQKASISQNKIEDFVLSKRQFNPLHFIQNEKSCGDPVGLSWFQCSWDDTCTHIFHNILDMREPTYEWIQPPQTLTKQIKYPESAPFNIYMDLYRDQKEINKQVLIERIKMIHPFEYKNLFKPSKLPVNIHRVPRTVPSWYLSTIWKRRNKLGFWRYLRNASAILPLDNNLDLDYPIWPHSSKLAKPMRYPYHNTSHRPFKDSKWAIPLKDHPSIRLENEDIKSIREKEKKEDLEILEQMEIKNK